MKAMTYETPRTIKHRAPYKGKLAQPIPMTQDEAWSMLGKSVARIYKEYELPLLYAALLATWTWVFIK